MPETALLTTRELCAATGATPRMIQYWVDTGLLKCACRRPSKPGQFSARRFEPREVLRARLAATLWKRGVGFIARRRALMALARRKAPAAPFWIVAEGREVHFAKSKRDVIEIALAATRGVVVVEVAA
jgi:DNA-binding transcriptional MerR regulator